MSRNVLSKKEMFAFLNRVLAYLDSVDTDPPTEEWDDIHGGCVARIIEMEMQAGTEEEDKATTAVKLVLDLDDISQLFETPDGDECPLCQCGTVEHIEGAGNKPSEYLVMCRGECGSQVYGDAEKLSLTAGTRKQLEEAIR